MSSSGFGIRILRVALLALPLASCRATIVNHGGGPPVVNDRSHAPSIRPPIADVLRRHTPSLLAIPGVVGTAEGRSGDDPVFVVYVIKRTPELLQRIPGVIEGYHVEIDQSGEITAPPH
jgi:hypothetical protein